MIVALATHLGLDGAEEEVLGRWTREHAGWMDAEFRSGILLRRGVCTIRARSILNAAAWWGSPAGLARRPYAPSLVYQCIGVAIGAHNMQIRVRGLLFFTCRYRLWDPDPHTLRLPYTYHTSDT